MGLRVVQFRVLLTLAVWCILNLLANAFVLSLNSRLPHGTAVQLPSLTPSALLGRRTASSSGSFLSMATRERSRSLGFAEPKESAGPEISHEERRPRSRSLQLEQGTVSAIASRDSETPNLLQPQQQQQAHNQQNQRKRRLIRLARLQKVLKRIGGTTKEKLRRLWWRLQHGASRAKRAVRRAVVAIYKNVPRLRRHRRSSEGAERAASSGLTRADLAAAANSQRPGDGSPERADAINKGEAPIPMESAASTTITAAEEGASQPAQAEAATPASEGVEQADEDEEWHEAPEQAEEPQEEWHDAITPEQMENVLARARQGQQRKEAEKERLPEEAEQLGLSPQCLKFFPRMTTTMKRLNREWRGHCMFWTLFMQKGNLDTTREGMEVLAVQTMNSILKAEQLKETETSIDAQLLRTTLALVLAEEALAKAKNDTDENCWLTNPDNLFDKANNDELKVLQTFHPVTFFTKPLEFMRPLSRLIELLYTDSFKCLASAQAEIGTRKDLQQILTSEKQKLEAVKQQMSQPLSSQQTAEVVQVLEELEKLLGREFCSIEQLHLLFAHAKNIQGFVADYRANGHNWWRPQWLFKLEACRTVKRGSAAVPKDVAKSCQKYESSRPPKGSDDVSNTLLWMWEAGSSRKGQ